MFEILRARYVTMIPVEMKRYHDDITIHFSNDEQTEFYSVYDTDFCDRSDLIGLNLNLSAGDITTILDISETQIGKEENYTHLVKDRDDFFYVIEMKKII